MKPALFCLLLSFAATPPARAQAPAARVSDPTSHGGVVVGPGVPTVRVGSLPAAVVGDLATCPQVGGVPPILVPHVGGPIVTGSSTVRIGGRPAARAGDSIAETGASAVVIGGAATVRIGP